DDADVRGLFGSRVERGEAVPVGRLELEILMRDGRTGDHKHRWQRVELETHGGTIMAAWPCSNRTWSGRTSSRAGTRGWRRSSRSYASARRRSRLAAANAPSCATAS